MWQPQTDVNCKSRFFNSTIPHTKLGKRDSSHTLSELSISYSFLSQRKKIVSLPPSVDIRKDGNTLLAKAIGGYRRQWLHLI